jgi:hypothetical protein
MKAALFIQLITSGAIRERSLIIGGGGGPVNLGGGLPFFGPPFEEGQIFLGPSRREGHKYLGTHFSKKVIFQ